MPALFGINQRFRNGQPSARLEEAGVVLKMFDGLETPGRPWQACEGDACHCQGQTIPGRVSAMIAYRGLRDRPDRRGLPLPFGDRSGLVLRPSEGALQCMYGIDAASAFHLPDPETPGCSKDFCDPNQPCYHGSLADGCQEGSSMCGFTGAPPQAWRPDDLKLLLKLHATV